MKNFFCTLAALVLAACAFAQTPEEIVTRMDAEMDGHEKDGIMMTVEVKVPVVGSMYSTTYSLGDKTRIDAEMLGVKVISWYDGVTEWTYNPKTNEVEIKNEDKKPSSEEGNPGMFSDILDGYDVSLKSETDKAWFLTCKKSRSNKDKDAPKTMILAVEKGTYHPISLSMKASGMTLIMRDIKYGVKVKDVTFDPKDFPDATIVDKRK